MALIEKILFPVDFSPASVAMAAYVQKAAHIFRAGVSLLHVVDLTSSNGFELYLRPTPEIALEHLEIGQRKLESFLTKEFPLGQSQRILTSGDAATQIAQLARDQKFDLIMMPTHAGLFRQMLLGSTTAKVLDDADCPVFTSRHAVNRVPRPLEHREWLCAIGLSSDSERVLRFALEAASQAQAKLTIIHAVQAWQSRPQIELDLEERFYSAEREKARSRIAELQHNVGSDLPVRIAVGSVKEALLETARRTEADVLMIGRSPRSGAVGRLRDLTYAMIRDSPYPVLSV
jgi:nucleotide-binding universal stress UspA family protein